MAAKESSKQSTSSTGVTEKKAKKITKAQAEGMISKGVRGIKEEDVKEILDRTEEIKKKFEMPGPLARFIEDVKLLISVLKDYWSGKYREIPFWTIGAIVFALLYVLNPMDLIPDFIPGVGLLDDAAVVAACLALIEKDLKKYKEWKTEESG
jgi:uncharacterized membrane protein YkvA (DUF1232 family)